ncbi:MAG TPA: 30S ribosome-binding factor RbfA [Bryobacteraceae bacterium]|nr:30S ribosome-binding factor RbfA [Bryobacteraceae bacterium]
MQHRTERIAEALREELSELISYELSDPRIGSATVTDVQVSPDKRHAFVRVRVEDGANSQSAIAALEHAGHFLRHELAARLELFRVPELHFQADIATELGGRMDQLLKRIKKGRPRE